MVHPSSVAWQSIFGAVRVTGTEPIGPQGMLDSEGFWLIGFRIWCFEVSELGLRKGFRFTSRVGSSPGQETIIKSARDEKIQQLHHMP